MPKTIPLNAAEPCSQLPAGWQQQLSQAITEPQQLLQQLRLDSRIFGDFSAANTQFNLKVPQAYVNKIQPENPRDPLLLQVMTQSREMLPVAGYHRDPVGDLNASQVPGLLHKYHGRVLLITTAACAIHCRYCFRRHFPYAEQQAGRQQWQEAINYIQQDNSIEEVILSGGDPLVLSDNKLAELLEQLAAIPHLLRLRIHTRLPVVLADRITPDLIDLLSSSRLNVCMVIHANHAQEIGKAETHALQSLQQAGISLLNQAVLLHDINASLQAQQNLSKALFNAGVLPYYLHLLDPVEGAAHFDTALEDAQLLIKQMRETLPGYLIPRLVREIAGEMSKTPADEL